MAVLLLLIGVAVAAIGGDRFVRGAVGVSVALHIPAGIVGATIGAFATSSPELSVAVLAALDGDPAIALGDATGSNLVNLGAVLAITVVLAPVVARWADIRRDLPAALAATGLLGLLAADDRVSRFDAAALLALFAIWIGWVVIDARRERSATAATLGERRPARAVVDLALGLVLLVVAARLIVKGAKQLGDMLGWDDFTIGAILVAIGTSTPELVTSLVAARRGHAEVGIGALLGSNVFNALFIVGIASAIEPIGLDGNEVAIALGFGLAATVAAVPSRTGRLGRGRGALLFAVYVAYLVTILTLR